jgi:hypothetical protein
MWEMRIVFTTASGFKTASSLTFDALVWRAQPLALRFGDCRQQIMDR